MYHNYETINYKKTSSLRLHLYKYVACAFRMPHILGYSNITNIYLTKSMYWEHRSNVLMWMYLWDDKFSPWYNHTGWLGVKHQISYLRQIQKYRLIGYMYISMLLFVFPVLRSCVKVEVVVLGSPSLIRFVVSVDVKQHWNKMFPVPCIFLKCNL